MAQEKEKPVDQLRSKLISDDGTSKSETKQDTRLPPRYFAPSNIVKDVF